MLIVYVLAGLALSVAVFAGATALAGRAAGLRVARVTLGAGPSLTGANVAGTALHFAPLPITSSVQFEEEPRLSFADLPLVQALLVQLAGPAAMAAPAAVLLGGEAFDIIARVWMGAFGLLSGTGHEAMRHALEALQTASPVRAIGLVASANAAIQLLPFPPLPAGMALLRIVSGNRLEAAQAQLVFKAGLLACFVLAAFAVVTLVSVLRGA